MSEDSEYKLVEKGPNEKNKLKNTLLRKQDENIINFFNEFRASIKNSNRRDKLMMLLYHELDKTLSYQDKEYLSKRWRPGGPIILVTGVNQLEEIRNHLNSLALGTSQQPSQYTSELPTSQTFTFDGAHNQPPLNANNLTEFMDMYQCPMSQNTNNSGSENFSWESMTYLARSNDIIDIDIIEDVSIQKQNEESIIIPKNLPIIEKSNLCQDTNDIKDTSKYLFTQLSVVIQTNGDVATMLSSIKNSHGVGIYKEILNYCDKDQEPIIFQLVSNFERHKNVLDILKNDGVLNLSQKNYFNTSLFYFLIMTNIDEMYNFLKFTKALNLKSEVQNICLENPSFKTAILQKKHEVTRYSTPLRMKLEVIEKYCLNLECQKAL